LNLSTTGDDDMKISNSKKQLAKIINKNGGWRDGLNFAAQDGDDGAVWFYSTKPTKSTKWWKATRCAVRAIVGVAALPNWHQTILSSEEYFYLYPENSVAEEEKEVAQDSKPSTDQLLAAWKSAKAAVSEASAALESAKLAAAEAESAVKAALGEYGWGDGLVSESGLEITNRCQLELGDVIWIGESKSRQEEDTLPSGRYVVVKVGVVGVLHNDKTYYPDFSMRGWKFISRP